MLYDTDRDRLVSRLKAAVGEEAGARVEGLIRPTVGLIPDASARGLSKLGGRPDLADGVAWPSRPTTPKPRSWLQRLTGGGEVPGTRSLPFVGQVALDEVPAGHLDIPLPANGLLQFFYDMEADAWGFSPGDDFAWSVVFSPKAGVASRPVGQTVDDVFTETRLRAEAGWITPPHDYESAPGAPMLSPDEADVLGEASYEAEAEFPPPVRLGGWPMLVQNDVQSTAQLASNGIDCGGPEGYRKGAELRKDAWRWRLLLEVGSVDEAGMMWGDVGSLYFQMRDEDLASARWDKAWMEFQCH